MIREFCVSSFPLHCRTKAYVHFSPSVSLQPLKRNISLNDDCLPFTLFQENGEIKTFIGNKDVNTVRKNSLPSVIYTRAIRFYPKSYNDSIALRVELYGYPAGKVC